MADLTLVVGLGNPGPAYAATRHNVGFFVVDELANRLGGKLKPVKGRRADAVEGRLEGQRVVLAEPSSYMNESGGPVSSLASFYKLDVGALIVVHDELDIPFGTVRLKRGGGDNGHNGLRSITSSMGSKEYLRVRVGIGRPPGRQDPADFVLKPFGATERKDLPFLVDAAADAAVALLIEPLEAVQNRFHSVG